MKSTLYKYRSLIYLFILGFTACSPANSGLVGYSYHNITAKFNAYFIAKEKLDEVMFDLNSAHENNFNKTLKVFAPIDTNIVNSNKEKIEDIVKKASIGIQRHEVSKWVDDCYVLIGVARMLNREYEESIETFKFVNVNSEDDPTKHQALINLIRTFTEYEEYNNALAVIDYLNRQKLTKVNKRNLYLQAANFYQVTNNPNNIIKYLSAAAELMKRGEEKAKIHYILAQLYQQVGFDAMAYENYQNVLSNKPPYEFSFHARLNIAQVTEIGKGSDVKKIRKYFDQLLKDGKNVEFRDKIYYEMAEFEIKQGNIKEAIPYYKSSIRESVSNARQKSFSYHKLGILYFEELKEYPLAKAYYDSAATTMPKDEEIYPAVQSRQEVLSEFIQQIDIIQNNDSLLSLAKMDSAQLHNIFLTQRAEKIAKKEEEDRLRRKEDRNRSNRNMQTSFNETTSFRPTTGGNGKFYFYDQTTLAAGRNEFRRIWGNRSLQDNWRINDSEVSEQDLVAEEKDSDLPAGELANQQTENPVDEAALIEQEKSAFYAKIPFSEDRKTDLNKEMEIAYYKLGNIYNFDLKEKKDAVETYTTLIERYTETEYKPEVLYLLYIYFKDINKVKAEQYANQLTLKFPETIFAKLIKNPNYREESNLASAKVKVIYEKAFRAYDSSNYKIALKHISDGLNNYPENEYEDNLKLLDALITAQTEGRDNYVFKLQQFIKKYPESELWEFSKQLLQAVDNLAEKQRAIDKIKYLAYFDQSHYFVVIYENNKALSGILPNEIENFAKENFPKENLSAGNLVFNDAYSMILLSEFKNKETAESFYAKFNSDLSPLKNFKSLNFSNFIISKDNFQIFYKAKLADSYNDFFKEHYKLTP